MSAVTKPIWMATLVTKQDLWWPQRGAVRSHYEAGAYSQAIRELASAIGERNFQHEFIPVSLTISSLCSQAGTVLVPTAAGYDLPIHLRYLRSMFERFNRFLAGGRR